MILKKAYFNIESWKDNFPNYWRFKIVSSYATIYDEIDPSLINNKINAFSQLKVIVIKIDYPLNEPEFLLISKLLQLPNIKLNLYSIYLELGALDNALTILDYCCDFKEINEIVLRFRWTHLSNDETQYLIKEAKKKITLRIGLIRRLDININS